jgi:Tfp pilus assembly protein PilF
MFKASSLSWLIAEKIPLFVLSAAIIIISQITLQNLNDIIPMDIIPLSLRFQNALVSYVLYIYKTFWPLNLSVFYPYPHAVPLLYTLWSGVILFLVSSASIALALQTPFLIVGWLWYLGALVPVIGLIQTGLWPAMADRWAYVPLIGIFIIIAWGGEKILSLWKYNKIYSIMISAFLLPFLILISERQTAHWQNSISLFEHALKLDSGNEVIHYTLGSFLSRLGKTEKAVLHLKAALEINPQNSIAHNNLGNVFLRNGTLDEAIFHYARAIEFKYDNIEARINLANALIAKKNNEAALNHFQIALKQNPDYAPLHYYLGIFYAGTRQFDESIVHLNRALELSPNNSTIMHDLEKVKKLKQTN